MKEERAIVQIGIVFIIMATLASVALSGYGNYLTVVSQEWYYCAVYVSVFVIVDLSAVRLSILAAYHWAHNNVGAAILCVLIVIACGVVGAIPIQRTMVTLFHTNDNVAQVENQLDGSQQNSFAAQTVEAAERSVANAELAIAQLDASARVAASGVASAKASMEHPKACGPATSPATPGPICIERTAAYNQAVTVEQAAVAALQAAQLRLREAEQARDDARKEAKPKEASSAALVAAATPEWQRNMQSWILPIIISFLAPLLGGLEQTRRIAVAGGGSIANSLPVMRHDIAEVKQQQQALRERVLSVPVSAVQQLRPKNRPQMDTEMPVSAQDAWNQTEEPKTSDQSMSTFLNTDKAFEPSLPRKTPTKPRLVK